MEFDKVLASRHSVRAFADRPVDDALLTEVLDKAATAPSWSNTQPYMIAVARDEALEALRKELPERFREIARIQRGGLFTKLRAAITRKGLPDGDFKPILDYPDDLQPRRVATGRGLYDLLGIGRDDRAKRDQQMAENFRFFGAPVAVFVFIHEGLGVYSALDAGIFLQSLMLSATNAGLATCAQGALGLWRSPLEKHFDIPKHYKLLCGVSMGYEADALVNRFQPEKLRVSELTVKSW